MQMTTTRVLDTRTTDDVISEIAAEITEIEAKALPAGRIRVSDLMRLGAEHTTHTAGWGQRGQACAWSATGLTAAAFGVVK